MSNKHASDWASVTSKVPRKGFAGESEGKEVRVEGLTLAVEDVLFLHSRYEGEKRWRPSFSAIGI